VWDQYNYLMRFVNQKMRIVIPLLINIYELLYILHNNPVYRRTFSFEEYYGYVILIIIFYPKGVNMKKCSECQHDVSEQALACPHCGAPYPAKEKWDGWGFEYKSKTTIMGLPLLHISFKHRPNKMPVPAKGIISIGQFGIGIINISQFGIGIISVSQFTIAFYALAQFAIAYSLIAQIGLYINEGYGQLVWNINNLIKLF